MLTYYLCPLGAQDYNGDDTQAWDTTWSMGHECMHDEMRVDIHTLSLPTGRARKFAGLLAEGSWVQTWKLRWDGSGREFDLPTSKLEIVHFKIKTLVYTIFIQCMLASVCLSHSKEGPCRMREAVVDIGKARLRASPTEYH